MRVNDLHSPRIYSALLVHFDTTISIPFLFHSVSFIYARTNTHAPEVIACDCRSGINMRSEVFTTEVIFLSFQAYSSFLNNEVTVYYYNIAFVLAHKFAHFNVYVPWEKHSNILEWEESMRSRYSIDNLQNHIHAHTLDQSPVARGNTEICCWMLSRKKWRKYVFSRVIV